MKTELQQLIEAAESLSNTLEQAANNEKQFCVDMCMALERYSYETGRMTNEMKELQQRFGG